MMKYKIYEGNMPRVERHMRRIENKCKQYNCEFHFEITGDTFEVFEEDGKEVIRRFVEIEVEGNAIINDWRFIGSIEHTENGNVFHKTVDIEIPERYYNTRPVCEHCGTRRYRKYTYIVQNIKTGEFKQVGKTCLNDFTNGMDATFIASYYAMFNKLAEFETPIAGCRAEEYFYTDEILAYTSAVVKAYGFVSASNHYNSTASKVKDFYGYNHGVRNIRTKEIKSEMDDINFKVTEDDYKVAKDIINFIENVEEKNNYLHNLKVICSNDMVSYGNINLLCSAISCWNHELERRERVAKREAKKAEMYKSEYLGHVGDRIDFQISEWKALTSWENEWGITVLYRFIDINGNVIIWKSSRYIDSDKEIKTLKGTIKEHKEFNGVKQTVVTRCRIA